MRTSPVWAITLLLVVPTMLQAQSVRGTVTEDGTRAPISGALVQIITSAGGAVAATHTDSAGNFILWPRRTGSFTVRLSHPSYAPIEGFGLTVRSGETVSLELRMGRTPIPLEPVIARARADMRLAGFEERMRQGGFGQFLTRDDIEMRRGVVRTTDLLRSLSGVEIVTVAVGGSDRDLPNPPGTPHEMSPRVQLITMRSGTSRCQPTILIDGMVVRQFNDTGIDNLITPEMLAGVEVYTRSAGAPAEFVEPGSCGVVAFWSRANMSDYGVWSWKRLIGGVGAFLLLVTLTR